jgi:hypothetical protein
MQDSHYYRNQAALCLETAKRLSDACAAQKLQADADRFYSQAMELERKAGAAANSPKPNPVLSRCRQQASGEFLSEHSWGHLPLHRGNAKHSARVADEASAGVAVRRQTAKRNELHAAMRSAIGEKLRAFYHHEQGEPLSERLANLLIELERGDATGLLGIRKE